MADFDWSKDRRLQFMLKLDYAVIVDPRTPVRTGIAIPSSAAQTPAASALQTPRAANKNNNNGTSARFTLSNYCIYIKWSRGSHQSGKFAPLPLGSARTRDDGRINVVFPPADTSYELSFNTDFGAGAGIDPSKKFTISVYILYFPRTPVDALWAAAKRTGHFRTESDASQLERATVVEGFSVNLTDWLRQTRTPSRRRQAKLELSPHDLLVLDFAILRGDDVLPASIQVMPFDDRSAPASAASAAPSAAAAAAASGASGTSSGESSANNSSKTKRPAGEGAAGAAAAAAADADSSSAAPSAEDDARMSMATIVSEPDIRPGVLVHSRADIFRALSATLGQAAIDAKTSIGLTHLLSIFETGNRAVLKLPGLSPDAAFSLLLSNDSPFMTTFHDKRKDRGFIAGPWKELSALVTSNKNAVALASCTGDVGKSLRMRITGGEMRLGGSYFDAKEHGFLLSYQVPSDPRGVTNYVGHFHLQGSGMASAARVELAIHIGYGLFDSITAPPAADSADARASASCTVHFAMAVIFSSPTIEGRFRAKADSMIPKMLNALSTTARALLGADDLSRAASDKETEEEGRRFLRRHDARVSVDPLLALRPYAMKSNPCIVQHFLRLAAEQEATPEQRQLHPPMAPRAANLELIAAILTMHLKHESIVRLAIGILSRCLGRHGRSVITRCPGLSDAVERARQMYNLPYLEGGMTTLDQTVEQLLDREVHEDIRAVGVWKVLDGKSKVSRVAGSESSFFMGDIHRVRVTLPALKELFASGGKREFGAFAVTPQQQYLSHGRGGGGAPLSARARGGIGIGGGAMHEPRGAALATLQLQPEQVQILIALLSLHLNEYAVVDTVTFCLERTCTTCLVASTTLRYLLMQNVWNLYPDFRVRLEHLRTCFAQFEETLPPTQREFAKKFGGAALNDGEPVFQCPITMYEPVQEGDCELTLTKKSLYIGHMAFPLEHLYTIARTKVYLVLPAFKMVSQKPKVTMTAAAKKQADYQPLRDDGVFGGGDDEAEFSLLEGNKVLDDAFRDLDASVAANFGGAFGEDLAALEGKDGKNGHGGSNDADAATAPFAPFAAAAAAAGSAAKPADNRALAAVEGTDEVAVTYLAKCYQIDALFAALTKLGFSGRITSD